MQATARARSWPPLLVAAGAAADVLWIERPPYLAGAAALALLLAWRSSRRGLALLALLAVAAAGLGRVRIAHEQRTWPEQAQAEAAATRARIEQRMRELVADATAAAARAAALREAQAAAAGDRSALAPLFARLAAITAESREHAALAVNVLGAPVAWSGRVSDLRGVQELGRKEDVVVLPGTVSTTLVALAPVRSGTATVGVVTAEIPLAVRRNIRNEYLRDFDRLSGGEPGVEVQYQDPHPRGAAEFEPLPPGTRGEEAALRAPDGDVIARVRVTAPRRRGEAARWVTRVRAVVIALALLALLASLGTAGRAPVALRLFLAASAVRAAALFAFRPDASYGWSVLSADTYASTVLGPLLRSPLDLLLTAGWALSLAVLLLWLAVIRWRPATGLLRPLLASLLAVPVLALTFGWIADSVANSTLELERVPLLPRSSAHLVLQAALLLVLATGAALLTALFRAGGPWPRDVRARVAVVVLNLGLAGAAWWWWPRPTSGLPLLPAALLVALALTLASRAGAWAAVLRRAGPGGRTLAVLSAVLIGAVLLQPALVHYGEKSLRAQIERDYAPLVLRQPIWREYVLTETRRRIDSMRVLEEAPPGPPAAGLSELAYAVWSLTDLAAFGFSSAVEIQDERGVVISRFALNLPPSLAGPALPPRDDWTVKPDRIQLYSTERPVLHAQKRLTYHGEVHGGIHVYVGADYWNLPFLTGRDPYSVLYRTAARGVSRERAVDLVAYGAASEVLFSSADRPPAPTPELWARLSAAPGGFWTTLQIDAEPRHVFVFGDAASLYALGYASRGASRYAAGMVEAASGFAAVALLAVALVVGARSLGGRRGLTVRSLIDQVERRFVLRLFLAFTLLAFVPVAVVQIVVRQFVAERLRRETEDQALERAAVAKKAVEDFAIFQETEDDHRPVTDAALVWVASLIRNDLDVFERGRLVASSKRELYSSGLLPPRVPGEVFTGMVLQGQPSMLRTETIGDFSYLVVSVPVRVERGEPGILSIPLALRQREVQATVEDLDRTLRLASVLFLAVGAALSLRVARRISDPIRALTAATGRIAQGDLQTRVAVASRDELHDLVESFNRMAADLDRQRGELERSNRLAAWADMARQVAHEVKNPLTPIQLSTEHLRRVFRDGTDDFAGTLEACTQTILKQVRTLRGMVTEFSAFARPPAADLEPVDLGLLVEGLLRPYLLAPPPGVRITHALPEGLPKVSGDRRLLERAIVNLVENALQAVGERGEVSVSLRQVDGSLELEVADDGPGVPDELRGRIFEPFFSTKTGGTGLGLALVKKIAEDHGGRIRMDSPPPGRERGTAAVLVLPDEGTNAKARRPADEASSGAAGEGAGG